MYLLYFQIIAYCIIAVLVTCGLIRLAGLGCGSKVLKLRTPTMAWHLLHYVLAKLCIILYFITCQSVITFHIINKSLLYFQLNCFELSKSVSC